ISETLAENLLDFERWSMFALLSPKVLSTIRQACVFGSFADEVFYTTWNNEVMFGLNCSCSGSDGRNAIVPRRLDILFGKKITDLGYGAGPHVLVYGDLYSWGNNVHGQLGHGSLIPKVIKVSCGTYHSLALTSEGEVFAWGNNNFGQVGCGTSSSKLLPRRVANDLQNKMVTSIAAGRHCSMALTDNGQVYGWGYNGDGQLGTRNTGNILKPYLLVFAPNICIVQVVFGYAHTLALTDEGSIYVWGQNQYGELGTGTVDHQFSPVRKDLRIWMIEVAACPYSHTSAAMSQIGQVYMWGSCRGHAILAPTETHFRSTDDVFVYFSNPPVMWRMLSVVPEGSLNQTVAESLKSAFDREETADLRVQVEEKFIHVHKAVLKIRCEHFRVMFSTPWKEGSTDVIEIDHYSYRVYRAFLEYLYTDVVALPSEDALELLDLATSYCEDGLKKLCQQIICKGITVDNAFMLLSAAVRYNAEELEEPCFRFCVSHLTDVTQTEAFRQMDGMILKNFMEKAGRSSGFKH
uniref:BTB domain-containing protein n=1 Tax=Leptobrachium leishanense TaxID=445787 RepID=A0A8C5LWE2_9ANUR